MFKRILLLSALPLLACGATTTYYPKGITLHDIKTKKLLFGLDIHGVLVKKDGVARFGAVMGNVITLGISKLTDDKSWKQIEQLEKQGDISGEARSLILKKNGHKSAARAVEEAANAYKARKGMQVIVNRLATAGHEQRLASNIGPRFLENLKRKLKKDRHGNTMLDTIAMGKIVDAEALVGLPSSTGIDQLYLSPVPKPNAEFYRSFKRAFNPDNSKVMITIDDNLDNIKQAVNEGFVAIYFDTKRDNPAKDLTLELEKLGCFLPR